MISIDPEGGYRVTSLTTPGKAYNVYFSTTKQKYTCECRRYSLFRDECNHIKRVKASRDKEIKK